MKTRLELTVEPLSEDAFAAFGDVIAATQAEPVMINAGHCARHHDLAQVNIDTSGRAGISVFEAEAYALPLDLRLMERHPLGSQAFLPMSSDPFLIVVAKDQDNTPCGLRAFATDGRQGVNYHRGTWHAVLTPIGRAARFTVVDRIGPGANLEEHHFAEPPRIVDTAGLFNVAAYAD